MQKSCHFCYETIQHDCCSDEKPMRIKEEIEWWHKHMTRIARSDYAPCADANDVREIIAESRRRARAETLREVEGKITKIFDEFNHGKHYAGEAFSRMIGELQAMKGEGV